MSDIRRLIVQSAERVFRERCDLECVEAVEHGQFPQELWSELEDAGLTLVAVPEELGGAGAVLGDALAVLRAAGRHAVPLPLAETFLAGWLLSQAKLPVTPGPLTVLPVRQADRIRLQREGTAWKLWGSASQVPWAATSRLVVVAHDEHDRAHMVVMTPDECPIEPGRNLASEPRDRVTFPDVRLAADRVVDLPANATAADLFRYGALARAVLMAGSLESVLALTVEHARQRKQFGRPIGKFQAVQQQLAVLAAETAAATRAGELAIDAIEQRGSSMEIGAAKARVSEAAGICAEIAHQVHGAIGFTREHLLHCYTRRLWSWRDEFGPEVYWQAELGREVARSGPAGLWPFLVYGSPPSHAR